MNNQKDKRPTVKEIRNHLISKENMDSISSTSIKRILKEKLNYSFKRISTLEHNSARPFNIRKFFESAILQIKLEENNFELIFIDEFSLSSKHNKLYGWSKVGQKGYVLTHYDSFSMFFVVAFSERGIYGIKGASKIMNAAYSSVSWIKFLKKGNSRDHFENNFCIILNNASIHTSIVVNEFWIKMKISIITISPYSPSLNPWETIISVIKIKIRKKTIENRKVFIIL